jgi:xanthine/CO dehydrogenase XdhC/CoxF family maturation factor
MLHAEQPGAVLFTAWVNLLVFSAVGYVIGWIAGKTVEESVRARIAAELESEKTVEQPGAASTA